MEFSCSRTILFYFSILCYLFMRKKSYLILLLIYFSMISFFLSQWGGNLQLKSIDQF